MTPEAAREQLAYLRYRWTTPEMEARIVAAIDQRLVTALKLAEGSQKGPVPYPSGRLPGEQDRPDQG
jgi:hypothetical protein